MSHAITLTLPDLLFEPVQRIARATNQPVEAVLLKALQVSLPSIDGLPGVIADALERLEELDNASLDCVMREQVSAEAVGSLLRHDEHFEVACAGGTACASRRTRQISMWLNIDPIVPEAVGGSTDEENLWLSCVRCNLYKGARCRAVDPETGDVVPFFDSQRDTWNEHFACCGAGRSSSERHQRHEKQL